MTEYKIVDNFLEKKDLENLQTIIMGDEFEWTYNKILNYAQDDEHNKDHEYDFYLAHLVFKQDHFHPHTRTSVHEEARRSRWLPAFVFFAEKLEINSLIRIKCNLYPWTNEVKEHAVHVDYNFPHNGALFSLNTCDGYTRLEDGTKIESVENRMLLFNGGSEHCSTTTSNEKVRFNINFNFF